MSQLKNRLRMLTALLAALTILVCAVPPVMFAAAEETESSETASGYPYVTKTKVKVNLRAGRSTRSALLKKIPAGAEITVNAVKGSWAEVKYQKYTGYVKTDYIVVKKIVKVKTTKVPPTPTPVPTLSPEEDAGGYKILKRGSSGDDVTALQEALIELGYLKGKADGKFGSGTENAVISFQQNNDYPATGIMDANLQAFLYSGQPKNAAGTKVKVKTLSPVDGVTMKRGNTGAKVTRLQNRLIELGYLKEGGASGTYDDATISAVRVFQKKHGLTANGTADKKTQDILFSNDALSSHESPTPKVTATPSPTPTVAVPEQSLRSGDTGEDVKKVQKRLKELKYYKSNIDGKMGRGTVAALKEFQKAHGLEPDGVAGQETYDILFSDRALVKGTTPTPAPATEAPVPTPAESWPKLRRGDSGEAVAQLQEALIKLGYLAGTADGNYGSKTMEAVKAFQRNNGLTADGVAGEETQKVLYSGNAKKPQATATPTATPKASPTPAPSDAPLKVGSKGAAVKSLQQMLIKLGYLSGTADGVFGNKTAEAVKAYQKAKKLKVDGVAGKKTLDSLKNEASGSNSGSSQPTPRPNQGTTTIPTAAKVQYANWYDKVKAVARKYPYATVYDFTTGISWQIHIFSVGAHADYEPVTANDTAKLLKVFGGNTWTPKAVWVVFSDGSVYIGSTHSMPHDVQHVTDNNFAGHSCLHFPRTQEQVTAIGPYATKHQNTIDAAWKVTQNMK